MRALPTNTTQRKERGEVARNGGDRSRIPDQNSAPATLTDIGVSAKEIAKPAQIRDAERKTQGIVNGTLDRLVEYEVKSAREDSPIVLPTEGVAPEGCTPERLELFWAIKAPRQLAAVLVAAASSKDGALVTAATLLDGTLVAVAGRVSSLAPESFAGRVG